MFQDMYAFAMTIDHHYWKCDCKYYYTRQIEKEALESHSQKQEKASTSSLAMASQNKANLSSTALSTKTFSSKLSLSPTLKKQSNSLWVDFSSKLARNSKLTSDKYKKHLENNLCLYCGAGDYKLESCSKKQTTVTLKGHSTLITANTPAATSKKPLEKSQDSAQTKGYIELPYAAMSSIQLNTSALSDPHSLFVSLTSFLILGQDYLDKITF